LLILVGKPHVISELVLTRENHIFYPHSFLQATTRIPRNLQHLIRWIRKSANPQSKLIEIFRDFLRRTIVNSIAFCHQNYSVEGKEDSCLGLVDGGEDGGSSLGFVLKEEGCAEGCGGVEVAGGFVEEDEGR
jgi:hypothetical protein